MDMRSAYLDTELMLVIRSSEINKQLEEGMMTYEKCQDRCWKTEHTIIHIMWSQLH